MSDNAKIIPADSPTKGFGYMVVFVMFVLAFVFGSVTLINNWKAQNACENYQELTGNEVRYMAFDSCYVKMDDQWERFDVYRQKMGRDDDSLMSVVKKMTGSE
jgi:hypothetical protein